MAIRSRCFRDGMASASVCRKWTIPPGDAYRFRIRTTVSRPAWNPRCEVDGGFTIIGRAGGAHSTTSPGAAEDGIIFGWSPPTGVAPAISGAAPDVFISSPSLFTYTSFTRFRVPPTCRPAIDEMNNPRKAEPVGNHDLLVPQTFPRIHARSRASVAKNEITYFSTVRLKSTSRKIWTRSLKTYRLSILRDYYLVHR